MSTKKTHNKDLEKRYNSLKQLIFIKEKKPLAAIDEKTALKPAKMEKRKQPLEIADSMAYAMVLLKKAEATTGDAHFKKLRMALVQ